ncbi:MAG: HAD-IA family hydrolase [Candidatus Helarchaeota archaeon]
MTIQEEIKAIIFDWDGCLFNNIAAMKAATADTLKNYGITYDPDEALAEATRLIENLRSHAFTRLILNSYKMLEDVKFLEQFDFLKRLEIVFSAYTLYKDYSKESTIFDGVIELVEKLSKKYKLGIMTSGSRVDTNNLIQKFGLEQYFSKIISADDVEKTKPDPEGIEKILIEFNVLPSQAIYIGDLPLDIKAGKYLGCKTYAVSTGLVSIKELQEEEPLQIFRHITELTKVLPDIENIEIDIEADLTKEIKERKKVVSLEEKEKFSFSDYIKQITVNDFKEFLRNPYSFIRNEISQLLEKQDMSTENVKESLSLFEGFEHDLIQSLGYLLLHIINSRAGNIFENLLKNETTSAIITFSYDLIKVNILTLYPGEVFSLILKALISSFKELLPDKVVENLNEFSGMEFIEDILEGVHIGLQDLGLENSNFKEYVMEKLNVTENKGFSTLWEIVMVVVKVTLAALSIPMKVIIKRSLPLITDTLQVTRETISSTLDTVDFSVFDDQEGLSKVSDFISEVFDKFKNKSKTTDTNNDLS